MKNSYRKYLIIVIFIIIPLILGAIFYYIYCPDVYFVQFIDQIIKKPIHLRNNNYLVVFMRNHGLDLIWSFSLTLSFFLISLEYKYNYLLYILIPLLIGLCLEFLQRYNIISGTYDTLDIIFELCGVVLAFIIIRLKMRRMRNEENQKNRRNNCM